jgi:uncharacterized membrane protein YdbT with pleckstrin-like domain
MILKSSLISQAFEIVLISLILLILSILILEYDINPLKASIGSIFCYVLLAIGFIILEEIVMRKLYTYEIDDAGIKETFILFSKRETFIPYHNIIKIDLKKSFFGRMLNYGDIEILSSSATKIVLKGIKNPENVYQQIKEMFEKHKKEKEENE